MNKIILALATSSLLLTGCGHVSNAVLSDETLLDKAEMATGIEKSRLTLVERSGGIDSVDFRVKSGKKVFRCYFTSAVAITSDAICQQLSKDGKPIKGGNKGNCNALLKAAGKC